MERTMINEELRKQRLSEYRILLAVVMPEDLKSDENEQDEIGKR